MLEEFTSTQQSFTVNITLITRDWLYWSRKVPSSAIPTTHNETGDKDIKPSSGIPTENIKI